MIEILSKASDGLQNVYAPFPIKFHIGFCIVATIIYVLQFSRVKSKHYLLMALAVDVTLVTQFWTDSVAITGLFVLEVILLVSAGILSYKFNKAKKLKTVDGKAGEVQ